GSSASLSSCCRWPPTSTPPTTCTGSPPAWPEKTTSASRAPEASLPPWASFPRQSKIQNPKSQPLGVPHEGFDMRILSAEAMREVDRAAIEDLGMPSLVLMENAAI